MTKKRTTENITGLLHTRASFVPKTIDTESRTVDVTFATEREVLMYDWNIGKFNEILVCEDGAGDLSRLNNGAPLLDTHQQGSTTNVLGVVVVGTARFEKGIATATVRFSKRADVEPVFQDVVDGILTGISVGYMPLEYEEITNVQNTIPTLRCTKWEATELSLAPVQADPDSRIRSANDNAETYSVKLIRSQSNANTMTEAEKAAKKRATAIQKACRAANLTDEYAQELVDSDRTEEDALAEIATKGGETKPVTPTDEHNEQRKLGAEQERKRTAEITASCRGLKLPDEFMNNLITNGTSIDKARKLIIDEAAKGEKATTTGNSGLTVTKDETDKRRVAMTDGLLLRANKAPKNITEERKSAAREFRNMSLLDFAKDCLTRSNIDFRYMDKMTIAQTALSRAVITSSTSDFPVLLGGVVHQTLLAAYETVPDTWRQFCKIGSVSDFRIYSRVRQGNIGTLDVVAEDGEFKTKALPDGVKESIQAKTKGNLINVSRQMIVNDDLGAFTDLSTDLGRAAARSIEVDVYALLAANGGSGPTMGDGLPLFHASHGNIAGASAPGVTIFDTMRQLMAKQKDVSGNDYLNIVPSILLVPVSLSGAAKVLNNAQFNPDATGTTKNQFTPNIVNGMFSKIVDTPRLSDASPSPYYIFADPAVEPVLEVDFLDGNQTPFMDMQVGFEVDGIAWKVRHDYGVGAVGWRGVVKNPGV